MYKTPELDEIRKRIDQLDNQVHDLLMERADLVMAISAEKKKQGIQIVQPAREARMIRRLMARHREPLPEEAIVRIWRELVSCVSLLQTGLSVSVYTPPETPEYWDMARDYFGSVLPMQKSASPLDALNLVIEGKVNFAVLPWPDTAEENPWWGKLLEPAGAGISVLQRLPYGAKENYSYNNNPALIVARAGFDTSDDDRSFIGFDLSSSVTRDQIIAAVKEIGLNPASVHEWSTGARTSHLVEIDTYLSAKDEKLDLLRQKFAGDADANITVVGGYPAPLVYKTRQKKSAA